MNDRHQGADEGDSGGSDIEDALSDEPTGGKGRIGGLGFYWIYEPVIDYVEYWLVMPGWFAVALWGHGCDGHGRIAVGASGAAARHVNTTLPAT
jgi:hypothetical protein